jgi:hypothetical protein
MSDSLLASSGVQRRSVTWAFAKEILKNRLRGVSLGEPVGRPCQNESPMKKALITSLFLVCNWTAFSGEGTEVFAPLEAKIEAQLEKGDWHPAAEAAIRAQWADYKKAHMKPMTQGKFRGAEFACGLACPSVAVKLIEEYSGDYVYESIANRQDLPGPHLKIEVTGEDRVFVLMDSRRIPAVVNNKIIFFTDGELLRENAQFGTKAFASLNIEMIYRAEGVGLVMGPTNAYFDDLSRLLKFEVKIDKAEQGAAEQPATTGKSK